MSKKALWGFVFTLITLNCLTIAYFIFTNHTSNDLVQDETVATVGDMKITRQQWLNELEGEYGKEILRDMVNHSVILELAKKENIRVQQDEVSREMNMIKTSYKQNDIAKMNDEKKWKEQIKTSILLEEILTRDVKISDREIKRFYEENEELYHLAPTYHLSQIVVNTKKEANQVVKELENGSNFATLAREKSKDESSANQGGELGYLNEKSEYMPEQYKDVVKRLKKQEWSHPVQIQNGYAILYLQDKTDQVFYTLNDVKGQIRRQIALDQMGGPVTVESLWKEANVTWFYGSNRK